MQDSLRFLLLDDWRADLYDQKDRVKQVRDEPLFWVVEGTQTLQRHKKWPRRQRKDPNCFGCAAYTLKLFWRMLQIRSARVHVLPYCKIAILPEENRTRTGGNLLAKTDRDRRPGEGRLHRERTGKHNWCIQKTLSDRLHVLPCCKMSVLPERKSKQNRKHNSAQVSRQLYVLRSNGTLLKFARASGFDTSWTLGPPGDRTAMSTCMFYPIAKCLSHQRESWSRTRSKFLAEADRDNRPGEGRLHQERVG